ncbi:MAG: XTP/dITP diphosphatase [Methanocellales archaeon]|nr:XTP/dITP diphosphatase [Methanocellales archaeon]
MKAIYFVTNNTGKVKEAKALCEEHDIKIQQIRYEYPELQSDDLETIAKYGAEFSARALNKTVIVEDAGLFIPALGGFPGPYSAYVFKTIGNEGILGLMSDKKNREAYFESAVGYCEPGGGAITFTGIANGKIAHEIRGEHGFGYDPIFLYDDKTFGELSIEEKNKVSHRCKALKKFVKWISAKDI